MISWINEIRAEKSSNFIFRKESDPLWSEPDAVDRRAVHENAVLRGAPDDGLAQSGRPAAESEESPSPDASDGADGDLSEAADEPGRARSQDLSLSVEGSYDQAAGRGVRGRPDLYPAGPRVRLSRCDPGLALPVRSVVGTVDDAGQRFLLGGAGAGRGGRALTWTSSRSLNLDQMVKPFFSRFPRKMAIGYRNG